MLDQAHDLRRLAMERSRLAADRCGMRPTLVAVAGGKGGVGTTSVAVRLAATMAAAGTRTLLIDADARGGDAALRCGIEERYTVADLLSGRHSWADVMEAGPNGMSVVAGARWSEDLGNGSPAVAETLLRLLCEVRIHADVAVLDVGNSFGRAIGQICQATDAIVMVTTPETAAVVRAFAAMKSLANYVRQQDTVSMDTRLPLYVAVNGARSADEIAAVHSRLHRASRRLLAHPLASEDAEGDASVNETAPPGLGKLLRRIELESLSKNTLTVKACATDTI